MSSVPLCLHPQPSCIFGGSSYKVQLCMKVPVLLATTGKSLLFFFSVPLELQIDDKPSLLTNNHRSQPKQRVSKASRLLGPIQVASASTINYFSRDGWGYPQVNNHPKIAGQCGLAKRWPFSLMELLDASADAAGGSAAAEAVGV